MSQNSKLALIKELIESAESNIKSAKAVLTELLSDAGVTVKSKVTKAAKVVDKLVPSVKTNENNQVVIEGVFDGQNMLGPEGKMYSVPSNYASKSKLVQGDGLKLTITEDGTFLYKQIAPIEKKRILGTLTYDEGQYKVISTGKSYKVLLASVTYHKAEIGDRVTIIIPEHEESEWAAIENVIPKTADELEIEELLTK